MHKILALIILLSLLTAGCGSAQQPTPVPVPLGTPLLAANPPMLTDTWDVALTQTGGIMGMARVITVSSSGDYRVTDQRASVPFAGTLGIAEMAKLSVQIKSADKAPVNANSQTTCADCFVYQLQINRDGKNDTFTFDDTTLPGSDLEPLIIFLRDLGNNAMN